MLPSPLHPAIVHFPIVLVFLLPIAALAALWAIKRGSNPFRAWLVPVLTAAALTVSAWVAVQTGEGDEERAEDIVGEQTLHAHEEAAERFLVLSGAVVILMAAGLLRGRAGSAGRGVATTAALALIIAGYQVGHSGGRVAYGDGKLSGVTAISSGGDRESAPGEQETGRARGEDDD
jgi:uncharacterized membrane protein